MTFVLIRSWRVDILPISYQKSFILSHIPHQIVDKYLIANNVVYVWTQSFAGK